MVVDVLVLVLYIHWVIIIHNINLRFTYRDIDQVRV